MLINLSYFMAGRKVMVFKIRQQKVRDFSSNAVAQHRIRHIAMVPLAKGILPYTSYTEQGLAHWLAFRYGCFVPTMYQVMGWRDNARSPHKKSFYRLARFFVWEDKQGMIKWMVMDKSAISKSKAWREKL